MLPADRRSGVERGHAVGNHTRADPGEDLRAAGTRDRPRRRRLDGKEEARGVLLMDTGNTLLATDIGRYLQAHQRKNLLRFIACGSVDDGKSTLLGRLLYESKSLFED